MQPATTKAGKARQRMCWTIDMNEHLMRCYYKITKLETNTTNYRSELLPMFLQKYPELSHLTEQRLADQNRVIQKNNRITQPRLEQFKSKVADELRTMHTEEQKNSPQLPRTHENHQGEEQEAPSINEMGIDLPVVEQDEELTKKLRTNGNRKNMLERDRSHKKNSTT